MTLSCGHEQGVMVCKDCLEKAHLDENADRNRMKIAADVCEAQGFREVAASLRKLARQ